MNFDKETFLKTGFASLTVDNVKSVYIKTIEELEKTISNLADGEIIHIETIPLTREAGERLKYYIQDGVLLYHKDELDRMNADYRKVIESGKELLIDADYIKAPSRQFIVDTVEAAFTPVLNHYETRNLELVAKNDELETQLLQYKIYVSDITTAIQKNICKDFCPNIGQLQKE